MLTSTERERYDRQIRLPEIGEAGQSRLKEAGILIAGAGGLGSSAALYLAAAGIGFLRIVDKDRVELSNLNRQVLHTHADVGRTKVSSAREKLVALNPDIRVEAVASEITADSVSELLSGVDGVVDAMDNIPGRSLLNKAALEARVPFFHGAVHGTQGSVMTVIPGETSCFQCRCKGEQDPCTFPVLGVSPGIVGCLQAAEVVKFVAGFGSLLTDTLLTFNLLTQEFTRFRLKPNPECEHCAPMRNSSGSSV
jgi:adenylyltransferase/sulfurtransferase